MWLYKDQITEEVIRKKWSHMVRPICSYKDTEESLNSPWIDHKERLYENLKSSLSQPEPLPATDYVLISEFLILD